MRQYTRVRLIGCVIVFLIVAGLLGYYFNADRDNGHNHPQPQIDSTHAPQVTTTVVAGVPTEHAHDLEQSILAIEAGLDERSIHAEQLLSFVTQARNRSESLSDRDRMIIFKSITLFGVKRYKPATDLLILESCHDTRKFHWLMYAAKWPRPTTEPPPFEDAFPVMAALSEMGETAGMPLVDRYLMTWRNKTDQLERNLAVIELLIIEPGIRSAALRVVEMRLNDVDNLVKLDPDDHRALLHLKWKLSDDAP